MTDRSTSEFFRTDPASVRALAGLAFVASTVVAGGAGEELLVGGIAVTVVLMRIVLAPIDAHHDDRADLIEFFTSNAFPFHAHAGVRSAEAAADFIDSDAFLGDDDEALWVVDRELGCIGLVRLHDLSEDTPELDLRLTESSRGRGRGVEVLRTVTDHLFTTTSAQRFEGQTRDDNLAMRTVFVRAGWTKEAHYRRAWPAPDAVVHDAVAYAILREEWATGVHIPVAWDDFTDFSES